MAKVTEKLTNEEITKKAQRILSRYEKDIKADYDGEEPENYLFQNEAFLQKFRKADAKVQNEIIIQLDKQDYWIEAAQFDFAHLFKNPMSNKEVMEILLMFDPVQTITKMSYKLSVDEIVWLFNSNEYFYDTPYYYEPRSQIDYACELIEEIYPDRIFEALAHPTLTAKACGLQIRKSKLVPKAEISDLEKLVHSHKSAFPAIKIRCKKLVRFKKEPSILGSLETIHNLKWG